MKVMYHPEKRQTFVYAERNGVGAAELVEQLVRPPEMPLSATERAEVIEYEHDLFDREIKSGGAEAEETFTVGEILRGTKDEDMIAPRFFAKPFLDGLLTDSCGRLVASATESGATVPGPVFEKPADVYEWVTRLAGAGNTNEEARAVTSEELLDLAMQSMTGPTDADGEPVIIEDKEGNPKPLGYKNELGAALAAGEEPDPLLGESEPIALNPEALLGQFSRLTQVRSQLTREYRRNGAERRAGGENSKVAAARQAVLEVYLAKTNNQIAGTLPSLLRCGDQAALLHNEALAARVNTALPVAFRAVVQDGSKKLAFYQRLDYVRNGADMDEQKHVHQIDEYLWKLVKEAEDGGKQLSEVEPYFTPEEYAKIRNYKLSPEQVVKVASAFIERFGLLSNEDTSTFNLKRTTPAADNKWQVIINPTKDSFSVDSLTKTFRVPREATSLDRLVQVGLVHEMRHVFQGEADEVMAKDFRLAGLKGKNVSGLREAGAKQAEREAGELLFGKPQQVAPNMTYAKAIQALRKDGPLAAAQAFYQEKRRLNPQGKALSDGREAADRVVRLLRQGGYSSQPLAYAEEFLLTDSLKGASTSVQERAMAITCLSLADQVRLHRFALLPEPPQKDSIDFMALALRLADEHIKLALAA